jgi:hypothetical protein
VTSSWSITNTYFRYSPWLPVEAALSIFNVSFFVKRIFLEGINENEGVAINAES